MDGSGHCVVCSESLLGLSRKHLRQHWNRCYSANALEGPKTADITCKLPWPIEGYCCPVCSKTAALPGVVYPNHVDQHVEKCLASKKVQFSRVRRGGDAPVGTGLVVRYSPCSVLPASSVDTLVIHSSGSSDDSLFTGPQEFGFVSNRESALNPLVAQVTCFRDGSVVHVLKSNLMPVFDVDSVLLRVRPVTRSACGVLASSGPPPAAPGRTGRSSKRPRTERGSGSGSVEQTGSERSARGCCPLLAGGHGMVFAIVRAAAAYLARQWFKSIPSSVAEVMAALNWLVHRSHIPVKAITASLVSYLNRRALWTSTAHRLVCPRKRPRSGDSRSSRVASLRPRRAARSGGTTSRGTTSNAPQALARVSRRHGLKRSIATRSLTRPAAPASSASGGRCAMPCEACPDSPVAAPVTADCWRQLLLRKDDVRSNAGGRTPYHDYYGAHVTSRVMDVEPMAHPPKLSSADLMAMAVSDVKGARRGGGSVGAKVAGLLEQLHAAQRSRMVPVYTNAPHGIACVGTVDLLTQAPTLESLRAAVVGASTAFLMRVLGRTPVPTPRLHRRLARERRLMGGLRRSCDARSDGRGSGGDGGGDSGDSGDSDSSGENGDIDSDGHGGSQGFGSRAAATSRNSPSNGSRHSSPAAAPLERWRASAVGMGASGTCITSDTSGTATTTSGGGSGAAASSNGGQTPANGDGSRKRRRRVAVGATMMDMFYVPSDVLGTKQPRRARPVDRYDPSSLAHTAAVHAAPVSTRSRGKRARPATLPPRRFSARDSGRPPSDGSSSGGCGSESAVAGLSPTSRRKAFGHLVSMARLLLDHKGIPGGPTGADEDDGGSDVDVDGDTAAATVDGEAWGSSEVWFGCGQLHRPSMGRGDGTHACRSPACSRHATADGNTAPSQGGEGDGVVTTKYGSVVVRTKVEPTRPAPCVVGDGAWLSRLSRDTFSELCTPRQSAVWLYVDNGAFA